MVWVNCAYCDKLFDKETKEYNRKIKKGKTKFYCDNVCSGFNQPNGIPTIETKECEYCHTPFTINANIAKDRKLRFCSRECASAGSVTECRRAAASIAGKKTGTKNCLGNFISTAETLRIREAPKYKEIESYLQTIGINHMFEMPLDKFVFDLCLLDQKLLIEFDGPYHKETETQKITDADKNQCARSHGYQITRIPTPVGFIPLSSITPVLETLAC
jgi:very-short-patch-repair endonuclease